MCKDSFSKAAAREDKLKTPFSGCTCHVPSIQECARPRPWCARTASDTRHHKIRVGDLCQAVPGSHRASPGEPGGALQARPTVPTRKSARTQSPVGGKGLTERAAAASVSVLAERVN